MKFQATTATFPKVSLEEMRMIGSRKPAGQLQHTAGLPDIQTLILGYKSRSPRAASSSPARAAGWGTSALGASAIPAY